METQTTCQASLFAPPKPAETIFAEMCRQEQQLIALEREASAGPQDGEAPFAGWERIKRQLKQLVGWYCQRPALRSNRCWDAAYRHLENCYFFSQKNRSGIPPWEVVA